MANYVRNFYFLFFLIQFKSLIALSAPIPTNGSSEFSQSLKNMVLAEKEGFRLGSPDSNFWDLLSKNLTSNKLPSSWIFQGRGPSQTARFSIRTDNVGQVGELSQYVKKWIKEYPYLGFEILATNTMKVAGQPTFVIDLINKSKNKQLRQFVVHNRERSMAVIMTCTDSTNKFNVTLDRCHEILKNFQWTMPK